MDSKQPETLTKIRLLRIILRGSKRFFIASICFSLLSIIFEMLQPQIVRFTVDSVIGKEKPQFLDGLFDDILQGLGYSGHIDEGGADFFTNLSDFLREHLWWIAIIIVAVAACSIVCRYFFSVTNACAAETLVKTMRDALFLHLQKLPFLWYSGHQTGDIIQRCTSDVNVIKNFLSEQLTQLIRILTLLIMALFFMFRMNTTLAWTAAALIPLMFLSSFIFHNLIRPRFLQCDEQEGKLSAIVQENLTGVRVIRAFGRELYELDRFQKENDIFTNLWMRLGHVMSTFWIAGDLLERIQALALMTVGALLACRDDITPGEFIAFLSYNTMLLFPIRHLGRMISEMSKAGISLQRIHEIMAAEPERAPVAPEIPDMTQDIEFQHVTFAYPNCPPILSDVSFTIPHGKFFGILGGIGSGKSTLVHLLCRLYELPEDCGKITIGGTDISHIPYHDLRRNAGIVLQEPYLFSQSIAENIAISGDANDLEHIADAAQTACVRDNIEAFPDGFRTQIGERGVTLSGGQKQRIAIARLLFRGSPIMIFDDSLSAVDAETDSMIRSAIRERLRGTTVILISHRIATLMEADKIIVLSHGKIAESGTHGELLQQNGIYRRNYDMQMFNPDAEDAGKGATV